MSWDLLTADFEMLICLALSLCVVHKAGRPPTLRAWHHVIDFRAATHGASQRTTSLLGDEVPVREGLRVTFGARGRQHVLNLTRVDTFPSGTTVTYVRHGEREDRPPPLLPTFFARNGAGEILATGTMRQDGRVRVLVRDGAHGLLVVEPAPDPGIEFPVGMARPRADEPFAFYAEDAQLDFGDDGHLLRRVDGDALELRQMSRWHTPGKGQNAALRGRRVAAEPPSPSGVRQHRALAAFESCPTSLHRLVIGVAIDQLFVAQAGSADAALVEMAEILTTVNAVFKNQVRAACDLNVHTALPPLTSLLAALPPLLVRS